MALKTGNLRSGLRNAPELQPPDSAVHQWDASTVTGSQGDTVSTITDQIGNRDLSAVGDPKLQVGQLNGLNVARLDGTDDRFENSNVSLTADMALIIVFEQQEAGGSGEILFAGDSNNYNTQVKTSYQSQRGTNLDDGSPDQNPNIYAWIANSGATDDELRLNGATAATGDSGSNDWTDGVNIGGADGGGGELNMDLAEMLYYDNPTASDITDEESRLSDKWGIAI